MRYSFSLITLILLLSTSAATASSIDKDSDAYRSGALIGYVLLGGLALLVVIGVLRKKGILGSREARESKTKKWKMTPWLLTWISLFLLLAAYVLSYLSRRSDGAYRITKSGEIRTDKGHPLDDIQLWNPMGCWWQHTYKDADGSYQSKGNKMGFFYAPLITLDRRFSYPDLKLNRTAPTPALASETAQR